MMNTGEMKYFDTERTLTTITAVTTTWPAGTIVDPLTFNTLCVPDTGSGVSQRIGRDIKVYKIKIRGLITTPAQSVQGVADNATNVRFILVQDTQTNGAQMTSAQLLADQGAANTTINAFQNINNFGRFRVLKDKMLPLGNANIAGSPTSADLVQSGMTRPFKFNINFKVPISVRFNATNGGTIADIIDNSFHIICGTDNSTLAANLQYVSRVCYKEK